MGRIFVISDDGMHQITDKEDALWIEQLKSQVKENF